jgi:hypothetical protein
MKKVVRLTESDLIKLVKRVIKEQSEGIYKTKLYNPYKQERTDWGVLTIEYLEKVDYEGTELVKFEIIDSEEWKGKVLYFDCETGYAYVKRADQDPCKCGYSGYSTLEPNVENEIRSKYCPLPV